MNTPIKMKTDFEIGGSWGNAIFWSGHEQFDKYPLDSDSRFDCHGWKMIHPEVGQTLKAEFVRSWMVFEFVEVNPCANPRDMFFAVVKPINQFFTNPIDETKNPIRNKKSLQ